MRTLPGEIWKKIYSHLTQRDIRTCLFVCKAWNTVSRSLQEGNICIVLKPGKFEQLLGDLSRFPTFGSKIDTLVVEAKNTRDNPLALQSILDQCANLRVIEFTKTEIQKYFEMLDSSEAQLPNIRMIKINHLTRCSQKTQELYIAMNYKHSSAITTLVFGSAQKNHLRTYGGILRYLSNFAHLVSLEFWDEYNYMSGSMILDLNEILETNKHLETLCIRGKNHVYDDLQTAIIYQYSLSYIEEVAIIQLNEVPEDVARRAAADFVTYPVEKRKMDYTFNGKHYSDNDLFINCLQDMQRELARLENERSRRE